MENQNRLSGASSPYLQQHSANPVNWYEWGEEALSAARIQNKPLIISVGYAACHWCHVMARESFSDPEVAALMNSHFISVKVDREERPDLDQIYMDACQLITGNGGWPLNAFSLPDGRPFYAGTYFTKTQWINLLSEINNLYKNRFPEIEKQAASLTNGISGRTSIHTTPENSGVLTREFYNGIFPGWKPVIDMNRGGYTGVPKFIIPAGWEFLLQYHYLTGDPNALNAVLVTLEEIAKGGICDQIGGGFFRYSVDDKWLVPHFEKMLYDNGQLVSLFSHAFQVTGKALYAKTAEKILSFIQREMVSQEGGFFSSLNADSEGEEGRFYCWTMNDIKSAVDPEYAKLITDLYQVSREGNWEEEKNILHLKTSPEEFASKYHLTIDDFNLIREKADHQLLENRNKRVRPSTDDKILTSWNALMMIGFIDAYKAFGKNMYLTAALKNAKFLEANMVQEDGRIWRVFRNGKVTVDGFLDDYALLSLALIKLYQATFDMGWLNLSKKITNYCVRHFSDDNSPLFFYTSCLSEKLIVRKHEVADGVIPSSNSVMANVLFTLGKLFSIEDPLNLATSMILAVRDEIDKGGPYYANWTFTYGLLSYGIHEIVIMGDQSNLLTQELDRHFLPDALFLGGTKEVLSLTSKKLVRDKTLIYICKDKTCFAPVETADLALALIHPAKIN